MQLVLDSIYPAFTYLFSFFSSPSLISPSLSFDSSLGYRSSPTARGDNDALADWDAGATEDTPPQVRYSVRTVTNCQDHAAYPSAQHVSTYVGHQPSFRCLMG